MNAIPPGDPLPDMLAKVAAARAELDAAASDPVMKRDPYRRILGGLSLALEAQAAVAVANAKASQPLPPAELERQWAEAAATAGALEMKRQVGRLVRSMDGLRMTLVLCLIGGGIILGGTIVYALMR